MEILTELLQTFSLELGISITVFSYLILKGLELLVFKTSKTTKKIITLIASAILSIIFYKYVDVELKSLIPTYLISVAFYDNLIKFILNKFNFNYNK